MKSAGTVYRKLKEARYLHLVLLYKKFLKRTPENCKYSHLYTFIGQDNSPHDLRLCMIHQPTENLDKVMPQLIDVCHCTAAQSCNGFIYRYTKDDVKELFEKELSDRNLKSKKYPDICALEWVLDRSVVGIPPFNWIQALYYWAKFKMSQEKTL